MTKSMLGLRRRLILTTALAAPAVLACGLAHAQTEPAPEDQAASVQEVIVTAQRRSQRLQDVPMTVTALSAETLEKSGVNNTADLQRVTPGLTMSFYGNNLQPAIRGVTATGGNAGDNPAVAMYVDGVYQAQQIATLIDLPDVQQIEVLKGPQGTLYGQNATGGAIIVTTAAPSFTPTGKFTASYGTRNDVNLRGFASGPISDTVAVSLAGAYRDRDGLRRNVATGERDRGLNSKVVRGKLLWQPVEDSKITVMGYMSDRNDSAVYAVQPLNNNSIGYSFFPTAPRATSPRDYTTRPDVFNRVRASGMSLRGEFDLSVGSLSLISGYNRTKVTAIEDLDASPVNYGEYHYGDVEAKTWVNEATFASKKFGRTSFLVGALYMESAEDFNPGVFILRSPNVVRAPLSAPIFSLYQFGRVTKEIGAIYGEVSFDVTDRLVVTAGGRYTHETQRGYHDDVFTEARPAPLTPFPGNPAKWSKFSPRLTARYELARDQNLYATFAQGFKGGLINTANFVAQTEPVDPEVIKSYEVGYKGRPLDNVTLNISAFWYDYKNLQVVAYRAPDYLTQNAASSRGKGVDVDGTWAVTPEFTLSGGLSYLDAKYRKFPDAQGYLPTGIGNQAIVVDLGGKRLLRSPKWSGNLSANYQTELEAGRLGAFASLYYSDTFGLEPTNRVRQGAYMTVDAELSFAPAAVPGLRLVVWGKNLTDKDYLAMALVTDQSDGVSYGEPRTMGVRAEYAF